MQTDPHCFHAKRLNPITLKTIDSQFSSHIKECPDCISKMNKISQEDQQIEDYFDSLNVTEQTRPLLRAELKEAIELARPRKMKAIEGEITQLKRSIIRDGLQFLTNFFTLKNSLLFIGCLGFIILSRFINT